MFLNSRERKFRALVLQNHPKSIRLFEHSKNFKRVKINRYNSIDTGQRMDKRHLFTNGTRQIRHNVRFKKIVQTLMREDVFSTFAQMKHSLLCRPCLK
jgi:hypothetical protein